MMYTDCIQWLVSTALIISVTIYSSDSQTSRNNNRPGSWNYGDRTPLTGNQGNFYNPVFGTNGNPQTPPQRSGYQDNIPTSKPEPAQSVYQWSFQPSAQNNNYSPRPLPNTHYPGQNNGYTPRPQPGNNLSPQYPGGNNGYTSRPHQGNMLPSKSPDHSYTRRPNDRFVNNPLDRNDEFDLIDFQSLPDSYKTAFMSVEELVRNKGIVSPPGPNSRNVLVVFDNQTQELLNPALGPLVSNILPTLVPGTWRSMTFIQGCCSSRGIYSANVLRLIVSSSVSQLAGLQIYVHSTEIRNYFYNLVDWYPKIQPTTFFKVWIKRKSKSDFITETDDGEGVLETLLQLRYHSSNETLLNVNGQQKKVVHFSKYNPPMYQFIPHGLCADSDYSAHGHCLQGTVTMSLLIYDLRFNPPISFDFFNIPSFCNCVQF